MDPITAGIIAGGANVAGAYIQNQAATGMAREQMQFQDRMSSTAHQREVADLRAAGLNPILSALGSGASTPGGAMAPISDMGEGISKGADTAIAIRAQNKALEHQEADIDLKHDQANNLAVERVLLNKDAQIKNQYVAQEAQKTKILQKTANAAIKKANAEGDYAQINQLMGVIGAGTSSAKDIVDSINPFSGLIKVKTGK